MKSTLVFRVFRNDQIVVVKQFHDLDQIVVGSDPDGGVQVHLDAPEVSAIHCLVERRDSGYYISDLGSDTGTYRNGRPILDEAIETGDEIHVGPFRIVFFIGVPKPIHSPKTSEIVIPAPATVKPGSLNAPIPQAEAKVKSDKQLESAGVVPVAASSSHQVGAVRKSVNPATGKPEIRRDVVAFKSKHSKNFDTYAPASEVKDLRDHLKPGRGPVLEVIVSWGERVLQTYHFRTKQNIRVGKGMEVDLLSSGLPSGYVLAEIDNGVKVYINNTMSVEMIRPDDRLTQDILEIKGRISYSGGDRSLIKLEQNETLAIRLSDGLEIFVRFAPEAPIQPMVPLFMNSSETISVIAALIISLLTSFYISVSKPQAEEAPEDIQRVAQVIFTETKLTPPPPPPPPMVEPTNPAPPPPPPPPEPKKVVAEDKKQEQVNKGNPKLPDQRAEKAKVAGRAAEVKPKDSKNKAKMFTSTKQGGAIKTGEKNGANAQSAEKDPSNQGLLAAFGTGGARSKLDKAYNGSGDALGMAGAATGSSGFNENRAGDDLGSKFKDTGAGGKGTATQGIAGVGSKGRGSGMSAYGADSGFGDKASVSVDPGGAEAEFVGTIDREAVRRVVRSGIQAFKGCYERELKRDSKLEGKVTIAWEIREKGMPANARVVSDKTTLGNKAVEECVKARMLALRFPEPPPGTVAEVQYPFYFTAQK